MSGPLDPDDVVVGEEGPDAGIEVREGRRTTLPGLDIVRVLPTKGRRTVGPWCFVDCMLPPDVADPDPMEIGPHPHTGLSTVTWLFTGEALHSDSLGTEQLIRPGQLNLMTAGHGIAHAELGLGDRLQGIQMWVAQPEGTRHGPSTFEHLTDLPRIDVGDGPAAIGEACVFMGGLDGARSAARADSPLVGAELRLRAGRAVVPVDRGHEHAVVPLDVPVLVSRTVVEPGSLGYVPPGHDVLPIEVGEAGGRVMLVGGEPFEPVVMWWNFVARSQEELTQAWRDWQADDTDRFAGVASTLARIDAPTPPWVRAG